jgi:hypothetical protein
MAIAHRSFASTPNTVAATTIVVTAPAGVATNDVMIAGLTVDNHATISAIPSGWALVPNTVPTMTDATAGRRNTAVYYKVATGSEPSSYTWTFASSEVSGAGISAYSGVDTTTPFDANATTLANAASTTVTATGLTTVTANAVIVMVAHIDPADTITAWSGALTERWQVDGIRTGLADELRATAGATGNRTATVSVSNSSVGYLIALRPASTGPPPQTAAPDGDIATGTWTTDTGATATFAAIDESTASDADYDQSSLNPVTTDTFRVSLGNVTDPAVSTGHIVKYRYGKDVAGGDAMTLVVRLMQGATQISSWTHTDVPAGFTDAVQTLSGTEADSITDYTNLDLVFEATKG